MKLDLFTLDSRLVSRTTDTQCGRQKMLWLYLTIWEWELMWGRAVKAISTTGVHSPWTHTDGIISLSFYYINGHCSMFATSHKNMSPSMPNYHINVFFTRINFWKFGEKKSKLSKFVEAIYFLYSIGVVTFNINPQNIWKKPSCPIPKNFLCRHKKAEPPRIIGGLLPFHNYRPA